MHNLELPLGNEGTLITRKPMASLDLCSGNQKSINFLVVSIEIAPFGNVKQGTWLGNPAINPFTPTTRQL